MLGATREIEFRNRPGPFSNFEFGFVSDFESRVSKFSDVVLAAARDESFLLPLCCVVCSYKEDT